MIIDVLGFIYTFCFVICYWPQIIKSIVTGSVEDSSLPLFVLSVIGYLAALVYTIDRFGWDFWYVTNYSLSLFSAIVMIFVYVKYKK